MIKQTSLLFILFIAIFNMASVHAKVYKWVDENGVVHYGNDPKDAKKGDKVALEINTYDNSVANPTDDTLVMYSAPDCGICAKAKEYLLNNDIPFEERDIVTSVKAKLDFSKSGGKDLPYFVYKGKTLSEFSVLGFEVFYDGLNK